MDHTPAPEFAHFTYRARWEQYQLAYIAATGLAVILAIFLAYFTFDGLADTKWPDRFHVGVDSVVRKIPSPDSEHPDEILAWKHPDGRVSTIESLGLPHGNEELYLGLEYWFVVHCFVYNAAVLLIQGQRRRLGVAFADTAFWHMWGLPSAAVVGEAA